MKVLVAGDTHGNFLHMMDLIQAARLNDVQYIMQLGDFGYWEHTAEGALFLDELNNQLAEAGITLSWLCGNHDNHEMLWESYGRLVNVRVRTNILYQGRGAAFYLGDVPVQTLGGAYSIDVAARLQMMREGEPACWWETEELTDDQVIEAISAATILKPEIMFTHDAPHGAPISELGDADISEGISNRSRDNRLRVRQVVDEAQPDLLFHGHFHRRATYDVRVSDTHVVECHCIGADPDSRRMRGERVRDGEGRLKGRGLELFQESFEILDLG